MIYWPKHEILYVKLTHWILIRKTKAQLLAEQLVILETPEEDLQLRVRDYPDMGYGNAPYSTVNPDRLGKSGKKSIEFGSL